MVDHGCIINHKITSKIWGMLGFICGQKGLILAFWNETVPVELMLVQSWCNMQTFRLSTIMRATVRGILCVPKYVIPFYSIARTTMALNKEKCFPWTTVVSIWCPWYKSLLSSSMNEFYNAMHKLLLLNMAVMWFYFHLHN